MVNIKQKILQMWDNVPPTVRICCIKFAQRVVLAQSVASGAEHRVRYKGPFQSKESKYSYRFIVILVWRRLGRLSRQSPTQPPDARS